jgi:hypothetical protein
LGSDFPELKNAKVVGPLEDARVRAVFETHASAHLIHGLVFMVLKPLLESLDETADVRRAVFEKA